MAAKKKQLTPTEAKAAKQKKIAIGGGVLLLALLAFQVPRTMKMLHPAASPPAHAAASATPTTTTATPATPATGATAAATPAAATSSAGGDAVVVNADLAPVPLDGQLASFTRFTSKDPFEQQATAGPAAGSSGSSSSSTSTGSSSKSKSPPAAAGGGSAVPSGSTPTPTAPAPAPQSAVLSVNGVDEAVGLDSDFPAAAPLFHLVALTATTAKISIAGGSLASGSPTVTLRLGKPLTLMNTADGTRYRVVLVSTSANAAPAAAAPAASTSSSSTSGG